MTRTPWRLLGRHLLAHWLRTGLTLAGVTLALFLFCFLVSIRTSLEAAAREAASNRVIVQSAVSLFVDLPRDYQAKIAAVAGVERVSKFQWFGGFYREPKNFFAQFAVDHDVFFEQYRRDLEIVAGPGDGDPRKAALAALAAERRGAVIGAGLARDFGWKVGDTVPLIGTIFQKADGSAWEFRVVGIYRPLRSNVDDRTLWFRFDYLAESLDGGLATGPGGVGTYAVNVAPGHDPEAVIAGIDRLFAHGPQRTKTSTEAAFQAGFVSMFGNLPLFLGTIGGAVVFAVFFSLVNVMLLAARQRVHEAGILKALGFPDGALARLTLTESLVLSLGGGLLGIALAVFGAPALRPAFGSWIPGFTVEPATALRGVAVAAGIGLVAGLAPGLVLLRLDPVAALRSEG